MFFKVCCVYVHPFSTSVAANVVRKSGGYAAAFAVTGIALISTLAFVARMTFV